MWKAVFLFGFLLVACCATTPIGGGYEEVDVDDEGVVTAAKHASRELSKKFSAPYHHRLAKILKAKQQVVAGMNYKMDIVVGMTTCKKADVEYEELGDCDFQDGISTYKKCTVVVYRDLKNNHKLTSSGCTLTSKKDL